jgi:hypothetical protein
MGFVDDADLVLGQPDLDLPALAIVEVGLGGSLGGLEVLRATRSQTSIAT